MTYLYRDPTVRIHLSMPPVDATQPASDDIQDHPPIQCEDCKAALHSRDDHSVSFLLLDQLTVPIVGCGDHVDQFRSICELTTTGRADVIEHRPAGGIRCPSCQLAHHNLQQPVIPIRTGAVATMACPQHQTELFNRFRSGLETQQRLTSSIDLSQ